MLDTVNALQLPATVYQNAPHESRNPKTYSHVSTHEIIDALAGHGFYPVAVNQKTPRDPNRRGYEKHVIRMQKGNREMLRDVGDVIPQFIIENSHDGTSAVGLWLAAFRKVCANGLVVSQGTMGKVAVPHRGRGLMDRVIDATYRIVDRSDIAMRAIQTWQKIDMTESNKLDFAARALMLRFPDISEAPVEPMQLLTVRRFEDKPNDLWTTFNKVQENLLRGKILGFNRRDDKGNALPRRLRAIRGPEKNIELNAKLWEMAAEYAEAA